ncbi:FAD-binding oxidoreductase [Aquihabitans sp. G128]|uniref:NAD(P)/FAD-dependent oxidoreductase n=1 Tax=Aquihabitans sp. G128 TaxID=2849779 RepID=UPI001C22B424|nr:FAD-binding oxidoreductase [Aquihabitans sp. G128]QXC59617.1 FAD-binding oxidoreductase [Aquihabitans sp. G128]
MRRPGGEVHEALRGARPTSYWLDSPGRPPARPPLVGEVTADLAVVGGGYSGLWTALLAKERDPDRTVVLVEGDRIGWAASGRNGGFCAASLTHGEANGLERWPDEYPTLDRLGHDNLDQIGATLDRYEIDCSFERTGELTVATEDHQVAELRDWADGRDDLQFLDREAVQAEVASPTYRAGVWERGGTALVDPARLAWGLAEACERVGVRVFEHTRVDGLSRDHGTRADRGLVLRAERGAVRARQVALGTNVFPSLVKRTRLHTIPVYDHALMTEPLSAEQRRAIGWANRQGIGDSANRFHYYRLTDDDRILWGGYDAIYHFGGRVRAAYDHRPATSDLLARQFFDTFPQLEGLRFTHAWGGPIDASTRFCAFFGTAHGGDVAYAAGFTGLGVGATRFGAQVMLDLLAGRPTERTELEMVRTKPVPFPPEPLASVGIQATRWSLARADERQGRRNLWLRTLDRLGLGFDS